MIGKDHSLPRKGVVLSAFGLLFLNVIFRNYCGYINRVQVQKETGATFVFCPQILVIIKNDRVLELPIMISMIDALCMEHHKMMRIPP